jgi:hypothetical protein
MHVPGLVSLFVTAQRPGNTRSPVINGADILTQHTTRYYCAPHEQLRVLEKILPSIPAAKHGLSLPSATGPQPCLVQAQKVNQAPAIQ